MLAVWAHAALLPVMAAAAALLPAWCLIRIAHELIVVVAAGCLNLLANWPALRETLLAAPLDPIYTGAALEMVGKAEPLGIAAVPPLGDLLAIMLPGLFIAGIPSEGIWAEAVMGSDTAIAARGLSVFVADIALLALGLHFVRRGFAGTRGSWVVFLASQRRSRLISLGLLLQADVVFRAASHPPALPDAEALGLSFAIGVLLPWVTGRQMALSDLTAVVPALLLSLALALLLLIAAYAIATLCLHAARLCRAVSSAAGRRLHIHLKNPLPPLPLAARTAAVLLTLALLSSVVVRAPVKSAVLSDSSVSHAEPAVLSEHEDAAPEPPEDAARTAALAPEEPTPVPATVVTVTGEDYKHVYLVNGESQVVRGMGYNPMYADLDQAERARRYDRDFQQMKRAGVNTVFGWATREFDALVLDKAHQYGLGVAMPYDLPPSLNYADSDLQEELVAEVLARVAAFKRHPALRMWAIGNEVLHKIVYPSWLPMKKNSDQSITRARAFAAFYVDLIDRVHAADPDHPIILRDAEDAYLGWIRDGLAARPTKRPWFVYGVNVYTYRMKDIVEQWRRNQFDAALLISEFAPGGVAKKDRPEGYRRMWDLIQRHPQWTIGGVPYVWLTNGPEEVDRAFGLVGPDGTPVDGALDAITVMYNSRGPRSGPVQ